MEGIKLDSSKHSDKVLLLGEELHNRIVGQDIAIQAVVDIYEVFIAGLNPPRRPIGSLLLLGPTGVGKTWLVEATSEILFNDINAVVKVNCAEFQQSHEVSKLLGAPPGYIGHRETLPVLCKYNLEKHWSEGLPKLSIVLFDEIEKAHPALWQLLLGILDKAELRLGTHELVNMQQTMIFMTSNLGGKKLEDLMFSNLGFTPTPETNQNQIIGTVENAAKQNFSPEFINRLDKIVAFHPLTKENFETILELELNAVRKRLMAGNNIQFILQVFPEAKKFLLNRGTSIKYGARNLKRVIDTNVVCPLAAMLSTEQIRNGDVVSLACVDNEVFFVKETSASA